MISHCSFLHIVQLKKQLSYTYLIDNIPIKLRCQQSLVCNTAQPKNPCCIIIYSHIFSHTIYYYCCRSGASHLFNFNIPTIGFYVHISIFSSSCMLSITFHRSRMQINKSLFLSTCYNLSILLMLQYMPLSKSMGENTF